MRGNIEPCHVYSTLTFSHIYTVQMPHGKTLYHSAFPLLCVCVLCLCVCEPVCLQIILLKIKCAVQYCEAAQLRGKISGSEAQDRRFQGDLTTRADDSWGSGPNHHSMSGNVRTN